MRRASRQDANHSEIASAFARAPGCRVVDVHAFAAIGCDLLVYWRGRCFHVEIKDGSKPPSARKLTDNEEDAKQRCIATGNRYRVVLSLADVARVLRED